MPWLQENYTARAAVPYSNSINFSVVIRADPYEGETDSPMFELLKLLTTSSELGLAGLFTDGLDFISRLMYFPMKIPTIPSRFKLRFVTTAWTPPVPTSVICEVPEFISFIFNIGQFSIPRYFNNFADFNGYTKIDLYLPYYGFVSINPNDVMDKALQIRLGLDVNTGQATYYVGVNDYNVGIDTTRPLISPGADEDTRILSTHTFQLGIEVPVGGLHTAELSRNVLMGSLKMAGTALAYRAGVNSGAYISQRTSTTTTNSYRKYNKDDVGLRHVGTKVRTSTSSIDNTKKAEINMKSDCFNTAISTINSLHLDHSSDKPNYSAYLADGSLEAYLVIYRPRISPINSKYRRLFGVPLGEVRKIGNLTGYTEISSIRIEGEGFGTITTEESLLLREQLSQGFII